MNNSDIKDFSSDYLINGRKNEIWSIESVEINEFDLFAKIKMDGCYLSNTDNNQFHLTIFSSLEFLSQLMIIYGHVWAGLTKKQQEGWMVDSQIRAVKAIRRPNDIYVKMNIEKIRKTDKSIYCIANYQITDDVDGLFEGTIKGFLS